MTISSTTNRVAYAGNDVTTAFSFPYAFFAQADLVVISTIIATGVQTTKALTTDYTISGTVDSLGHYSSGGTVTAVTAPASTVTWTIYRDPAATQTTDLVANDALPAESLEAALDYQSIINQRTREIASRSLLQPEGDSATIGRLPAKVDRASHYLAFNASGDPTAAAAGTTSTVSVFMATVLDDTTAAAAATTLAVLPLAGGNLTGGLNSARGNITQHATTMDLFATTSPNILDGTGAAVTITACVNAPQAGATRRFYPIVATVLTHGATFDIAGNANLTAAAGDCWMIEAKTVSTYRVTAVKEDGTAVVSLGTAPNLLTNPNWQIDQLLEGGLGTVNGVGVQGPDGWSGTAVGAGVFKIRSLADPDNAALKCLEITCTTADASIAATDDYFLYTAIEGTDAAALQAGTASPATVTVQFKFKTTLVGLYGISIVNSALNRRYIGSITVADTSEHEYSVTLTMDTTGTWVYTAGVGLYLRICLSAGTNFQGTAGVWAAGAEQTTSAQVNFMALNTHTAYLKRIQLFVGSATQTHPPADYAADLAKCLLSYQKTFAQGVAPVQNVGNQNGALTGYHTNAAVGPATTWQFHTPMRAAPTVVTFNTWAANGNWNVAGGGTENTVSIGTATTAGVVFTATTQTGTNYSYIHATANVRLS